LVVGQAILDSDALMNVAVIFLLLHVNQCGAVMMVLVDALDSQDVLLADQAIHEATWGHFLVMLALLVVVCVPCEEQLEFPIHNDEK